MENDSDIDNEEEGTRKGKSTPYTTTEQHNNGNIFSLKQTLTFQRVFGDLEDDAAHSPGMIVDKATVSGQKLQEKLVTTGEFTQSDAAIMIDDMLKADFMDKVSWDTYRRVKGEGA